MNNQEIAKKLNINAIATKLGLKLSDYVITEADFSSDLEVDEFFNIKYHTGNLTPNCVVIGCTVKALKYNANKKENIILSENIEAVKKGLSNLEFHIDNMLKFTKNIVICLKKYNTDTDNEIKIIRDYVTTRNLKFSVNDSYIKVSIGSIDLTKKVIDICKQKNDFQLLYDLDLTIIKKIKMIAKNIYHNSKINYTKTSLKKIKILENLHYTNLPICIAKTHYSISDNFQLLGDTQNFSIKVEDINSCVRAGFIVAYLGDILTMLESPRIPNYKKLSLMKILP